MASQKKPLHDPYIDPDTEERDDKVITYALFWSLAVICVLAAAGGGLAYWLTRPKPAPPAKKTELKTVELRAGPTVDIPQVMFTEISQQAGLDFVHENGAYGDKLLPETMGGGCAFFDFDNDGDQDILLINSCRWAWDQRPQTPPAQMALYRNSGMGQFENVTAGSGLEVSLYGMGVAVGDYDNDGHVDVYISAVGANRLFHNEGGGKFVEVTDQAGVAGDEKEWSTSCGWFDYDRDGDLDLFVCNYVKWSKEFDLAQGFKLTGGGRAYGRPQSFGGTFPYLFRNDGHGKFTEVAESAGLHIRNPATNVPAAKSLGLVMTDLDRDGWMDVIVANDTVRNMLFHNQRNGSFREMGIDAGIAFDTEGNARGAMGADAAYSRNNESIAVAIGNFSNEMTALYVSQGRDLLFQDEALSSGLGPETRLALTFGVFFFDYDLNGRLDLFAANGHLEEDINRVQPSQHYEQPPQLFYNCGMEQGAEYMKVSAEKVGADFLKPTVGRGAAYADIDGDGDLDVLLMAAGRPPRLLRNDQQLNHHWLRLKLVGKSCNRDAIGALVELHLKGQVLRSRVKPTRSYLSQCELQVTFGLEKIDKIEKFVIHWPDGTEQTVKDITVNRMHRIEQP